MLLRLLHRILEIFLHVMRRIEQPFLRPAFNAVFRMPIANALTWLHQLSAAAARTWALPRRRRSLARRRIRRR